MGLRPRYKTNVRQNAQDCGHVERRLSVKIGAGGAAEVAQPDSAMLTIAVLIARAIFGLFMAVRLIGLSP